MKVVVLGAGMVGAPMAIDLAKDSEFDVSIVDVSQETLDAIDKQYSISTIQKDLSDTENVKDVVRDSDMVINAVPGFMGFQTLKAIIECEKNVIDIAFFPEDAFELDALAKEKGVVAVYDCGVAPGMGNILAGHVSRLLDKTENILTYVGGLPEVRKWPWEYKAPFSPIDVIEEYTRPARYVENGKLVIMPALSEPELMDFPGVGTLEVFNTDGLRSMAHTMNAPNMKEKTLRYPGHIEKMRVLREAGFFSEEPVDIDGKAVRPIELTTKLLFPQWKYEKGEVDITVMQVIIEGEKDGKKVRYTYDMFDRYDDATETSSMARTTGYTATVALRMVAKGLYTQTGISAPEFIGKSAECVEFVLGGLKERGIEYKETIEEL